MSALILFLVCATSLRAEDYRLAPGDMLRVMIIGAPELTLDVPIEMDGTAWFPLVGPIRAGEETLATVRQATAEAFVTQSLVQPLLNPDGSPRTLQERDILVSVSSYRPIYVMGDVSSPGEIPFRPGITIRDVTAMASALPATVAQRPASPEEIQAAATALAADYARIWRLKSILGTATNDDFNRISAVGAGEIDQIMNVERTILEATLAALEAQKQQLRDEIARVNDRVSILTRRKENEDAGLDTDQEELANVQDLFNRGLVQAARLAEVRRAALLTTSRALEIELALETARASALKLQTDIEKVDAEARIDALSELARSTSEVQGRRAELAALLARSAAQPVLTTASAPKAAIYREGVRLEDSAVGDTFKLMPGDVVEIRFFLQNSQSSTPAEGSVSNE